MRYCAGGSAAEEAVRIMLTRKYSLKAATVLLFCLGVAAGIVQAEESGYEDLSISTSGGKLIKYRVEIARTPSQMRRGLMFRDSLPENQGMLFIYQPERVASMWMRNTILSLDMIFIDKAGKIVFIEENTVPFSLESISAGTPVRAVLELKAGQVHKHSIDIGDKVLHPAFE